MEDDVMFPILRTAAGAIPDSGGRYTLEEKLLLLSPEDNVAVVRRDLGRGAEILCPWGSFAMRESVEMGHKVAIREIPGGAPIRKFSEVLGLARQSIHPGDWVHVHNVELVHDLDAAEFAVERPRPPEWPEGLARTFLGYRRSDGRVGTRNYIAVMAASNCASHVCVRIAEEFKGLRTGSVDGVVALPHQDGCGQAAGPDVDQLERTLKGIMLNPNVAGLLVVALGCEENSLSRYFGEGSTLASMKPMSGLEIQVAGGTTKTVAEGSARVRRLIDAFAALRRTEESVAHLILGLNCGGSDGLSGISANPALGHAGDLLIAAGGSAVLAETPEIYGAEQTLTRRAVDVETGKRLIYIIRRYQEYFERFGVTMDGNPSPGNKRGGLTNIVEKSLGAVKKGGSSMLVDVVDYAAAITREGLTVMDTPGYDPVSITGLAAGGCNVLAFTTGRGSAIGFPIVPVLKIASNSRMFNRMNDNMDVDAGGIIDGRTTIERKGVEIYAHLLRVASGELTKSEANGHQEFAPWRIGPVV